jgi:acetyl esterase/lipase
MNRFEWHMLLVFATIAAPLAARAEDPAQTPVVWTVDRTDQLGEHQTTVVGMPRVVESVDGKAVQFDGKGDALLVDANPLAGLKQFTVEVVFQPHAGGPKEQRFLHLQEAGSENRLLFETRLTDDGRWFLDTYVKTGTGEATLFAKESLHAIGPWFHAAVVVDGKTMRHFVNGKEELKADLAFEPLGKGQTSLGVRINKVFWYKGAVRQIRITPRTLEPKDFVALTEAGSDAKAAIVGRTVKPLTDENLDEQIDLVYARYGDRELHLDLFLPKDRGDSPLPAVLIVHGGGWLAGDKTRFRALAQTLALRGYVTAAIEYRLGGEAKFPAAIHDCNAAVRWLRANAKQHGIDPERIAAVGGSAGGHLVGLVAAAPDVHELQGDGGNADQSSRLQAAVVMAGPMDLTTGVIAERSRTDPKQSNTNRWLGKTIDEAPDLYRLASPQSHFTKTTPPILFMHGELDRPELNAAPLTRLRELGVKSDVLVYSAGKHGCWNQHPWFEPMVDDIDAFLASEFKKGKGRPLPPLLTEWGRIQFHSTGLLVEVRRRPAGGTVNIPRLNNPIRVAHLAGDLAKRPLNLRPDISEWTIELPSFDGLVVIDVETVGRPFLPVIPRIVCSAADGSITLAAHDAVTHGESLRYEPQPHKNTVGYWTNKDDWCEWQCYVEQPGKFEVRILQGCGKGQGGSEVDLRIGDQTIAFNVEDTGHFQNFKERSLGVVTLAAPQVHSLQLRPRTKAAAAVMDVRQVRLIPVVN